MFGAVVRDGGKPADRPLEGPRLFVQPHHFDRLRLDADNGSPGAARPFEVALTWNVFRTFELLPPAFWLRRLHARLGFDPGMPASSLVRVTLWPRLPLPAAAQVAGTRNCITVDAIIETEHGVWAVFARHGGDILRGAAEFTGTDPVALAAQAASHMAGRRLAYVVVVGDAAGMPVAASLIQRYRGSPEALHLRLDSPGHASSLDNVAGFGLIPWEGLSAILDDCATSRAASAAERVMARHTAEWLDQAL